MCLWAILHGFLYAIHINHMTLAPLLCANCYYLQCDHLLPQHLHIGWLGMSTAGSHYVISHSFYY